MKRKPRCVHNVVSTSWAGARAGGARSASSATAVRRRIIGGGLVCGRPLRMAGGGARRERLEEGGGGGERRCRWGPYQLKKKRVVLCLLGTAVRYSYTPQ